MISTLKKLQAKKVAQDNNGGFTLIELLIVIVVLGILAAVVVFSLGGVTGSSAVAACEADGATVDTAIAALSAQSPGTTPTDGATGNLVPTYLQSWPANYAHYTFRIDTAGTLWLAAAPSGGTEQPVPPAGGTAPNTYLANTPAAYAAVNAAAAPSTVWYKWAGSTTCGTAGIK